MSVIANNTELTSQMNEIYPSIVYTDYSKNLNFPITLFPNKIIDDMSGINFNDSLQNGGGQNNLFKILTNYYHKKLLNRLDMKKIIKYYEKKTKQ